MTHVYSEVQYFLKFGTLSGVSSEFKNMNSVYRVWNVTKYSSIHEKTNEVFACIDWRMFYGPFTMNDFNIKLSVCVIIYFTFTENIFLILSFIDFCWFVIFSN